MAKRLLSASEIIHRKRTCLRWSKAFEDAFDSPEPSGVWFVWGKSGSGKSTFAMQLAKELCRDNRVMYVSLEEGSSETFARNLERNGMMSIRQFSVWVGGMDDLERKLSEKRSPKIVFIDSFQYTGFGWEEYKSFKLKYPKHLFVFLSQADGNKPAGRTAVRVMYDASLKILVQGYKAFSKGRFIGSTGEYTIWEQGANEYWGKTEESEEVIIRQ